MITIRDIKKRGFTSKAASRVEQDVYDGCDCYDCRERRAARQTTSASVPLMHGGSAFDAFDSAVQKLLLDNPKARVYGIELEVPGADAASREDVAALNNLGAIRKSDGSLRNEDIEFNFPPLTAEYISRARILTKVASVMRKYADDPTDEVRFYDDDDDSLVTYGIHIHSNKAWMKEDTPYIVVSLIRSNPRFFRWLSGRDGYSEYYEPHGSFLSRYAACVTSRGTIEYRMFRSTYDQREMNVWLNVIKAMEDWAEAMPAEQRPAINYGSYPWQLAIVGNKANVTLDSFKAFVKANYRKYGLARRAITKYEYVLAKYPASVGNGDYDTFSLYASINEVHPTITRQRKVIERAQLPLPQAA